MPVYNVFDYGAKGDGTSFDTFAIQQAIDACHANGGGQVLLEGGHTFLSGGLTVKANIDFHLEKGARILGSSEPEDYVQANYEDFQGCDVPIGKVFFYGVNQDNISFSGEGTVDGNDMSLMDSVDRYHVTRVGGESKRPIMFLLRNCNKLTIRDIIVQNAPVWTIVPVECNDVLISRIRMYNSLRVANCDGIDPVSCQNVRISDCHLEAGDDGICLKTTKHPGGYDQPCEDITVTGCTIISTSAAIKFGTSGNGDFRNIAISNCVLERSNRGLSIQVRDNGSVENVIFSNIIIDTRLFEKRWWGTAEPIHISSLRRHQQTQSGKIRNIVYSNILCTGENGIFMTGAPNNFLENITMENISVHLVKTSKWNGGKYDLRPGMEGDFLLGDNDGIRLRHIDGIYLRNIRVNFDENLPDYYGCALRMENVKNMCLEHFYGASSKPELEPIIEE